MCIRDRIKQAAIVLLMIDASDAMANIEQSIKSLKRDINDKQLIIALNKIDLSSNHNLLIEELDIIDKSKDTVVSISAKVHSNIDKLIDALLKKVDLSYLAKNDVVVSNIRHYEALQKAAEALERAMSGVSSNLTTDLLAMDIRQVLHYLGEITGTISNDEVLGNIFKNFCIGK